jgi:AraC-like DNA-binding protein
VTKALSILSGAFGRVALLDMDTSLVDHAHHHCHVIMKASGPDQDFTVEGQAYPVRDDTAVAVNTWQEHEYLHKAGPERTLFLAMYIEPGWLAQADRSFATCGSPGFFAQPSLCLSPEVQSLRNTLVHQLAFDPAGNTAEIEDRILDLTLELVHRFSNWRAKPGEGRGPQDFRIRRALRNMREQVGERLDLDRVAAASGLSRPHFNHLFRRCTGVSPAVYGNALRVEAAVEALRHAEQEIGAISDELGFSAQSNFTRFFQQHTGTSPNQFRRAMACLA